MYFNGRPLDSIAVAESALNRPGLSADSRLRLGCGVVRGLGGVGAADRAISLADDLLGQTWAAGGRPLLADRVAGAQLNSYWNAGRYRELEAVASAMYDRLVAQEAHDLRGYVAGQLGRALLGQGRVRSASDRLREATALLRDQDIIGVLPVFLAWYARSAALLGEQGDAEAAVAESEQRQHPAVRGLLPDVLLARAWVLAGAVAHRP